MQKRARERVSAINFLILGLPGDKLTPGAASEAAFVCYWQELLWALVGCRSCWNAGMSQSVPTPVYLATRPESPVEGREAPALLTQYLLRRAALPGIFL